MKFRVDYAKRTSHELVNKAIEELADSTVKWSIDALGNLRLEAENSNKVVVIAAGTWTGFSLT